MAIRKVYHPETADITLPGLLYALADPARLEILRNIHKAGKLTCGDSLGSLSLPKSSLSHHFRILREAGLVKSEWKGTACFSTLRKKEIDGKFPGLLTTILKLSV